MQIYEELGLSVLREFDLGPEELREIKRRDVESSYKDTKRERWPEDDWERLGSILCERIKIDVLSGPPYDHYARLDALRLVQFWHKLFD